MSHEQTPLSPAGSMFTQAWLLGTFDRAIGTFIVTLVSLIGLGTPGFDAFHVGWKAAVATALSATILTIIKSTIAPFVGDPGTTALLPGAK